MPSSEQPPPSEPPDNEEISPVNNSFGVKTRARTNPLKTMKETTTDIKKEKSTSHQQQPPPPPSPAPSIKKKTVTFKNELETSDDVVIKKVYNPTGAPLVPIIKKECLTRTTRFNKSECIVRPSRLTEILKNSQNNIDKLNSITFRTPSLINVPSLLTNSLSLTSTATAAASTATSTTTTTLSKSINESNSQLGDKRFILPKRSVHSCRVIKPNKRFLDIDDTNKRRTTTTTNCKKQTCGKKVTLLSNNDEDSSFEDNFTLSAKIDDFDDAYEDDGEVESQESKSVSDEGNFFFNFVFLFLIINFFFLF